jgi:ATP-binding cassette subfamily B multidrug efflux pump
LKALVRLNTYFVKYKYRLIFGLLFVIASNLFAVFPAQLVRKSIDAMKVQLESASTSKADFSGIQEIVIRFSILIIAFALIKGLFMYLMRQTIIVMSRHIEFDIKNDIFKHYQKLNLAFYRKNNTGDLMARISEDVSRVRMYVGPAVMYLMNLSVTIIVVLWAMFSVSTELTIWVLLPLPILSYVIFYVNNIINQRSDAIQSQLSVLTSDAQEAFSGIRVIKAFALENIWRTKFAKETADYREKNLSLTKVDSLFFPSMLLLTGLSSLFTIWIGGIMVAEGKLTIGNIAEFTMYVNILVWPVTSLGYTTSLIQRAAVSQQRINEFLETPPDHDKNKGISFSFENEIRFENVTFTYDGKTEPAVKDITLSIKKGATVAIIGPTGSGKSTLLQLMLRLFEPQKGVIYIDSIPLSEINPTDFREHIGYATQDVFLFSDTIANNIKFGIAHDMQDLQQKMVRASKDAALHESITQFPMGYETVVGERGITLSGGQKQRVALARALIKKPDLLLLDDTLSAVDAETESKIVDAMNENKAKRTLVLVTHRASAAAIADKIYVIENGEISEAGSPNDLLTQKGRYFEMVQNQSVEAVTIS